MKRLPLTLMVLALSTFGHVIAQEKVVPETLKYDDLARRVAAQKGKVIVVDLWSFS